MFNSPYGGYPWPAPSQPIVFVPTPGQTTPPQDPLAEIARWKSAIEQIEKAFKKEDKKDDKKKDEGSDPKLINLMLLMILVSPITGPIMSHFFTWGLSLLPHP